MSQFSVKATLFDEGTIKTFLKENDDLENINQKGIKSEGDKVVFKSKRLRTKQERKKSMDKSSERKTKVVVNTSEGTEEKVEDEDKKETKAQQEISPPG